ncbi:MAG TPA: alpha/beta hydrolase [Gammaproteobacteria bacterium]|jgi:pimeloyl-ACP methyl ester carboxylesterase|nr:alpha/beta hydrolase [Gammaproteobacteria bacterium]HIB75052.1 alpha/beta hydrolase [Gammaproteobacteria bacterium]HIM21650.1 alpha/beta hydrolase [Gammaproteobacteria bacterium]HIN73159.1 alpha/beta hydrolase [Gammaproteobacteria bacterium]HIO04461.1 alpha/beta hydrolase [Gammaproteobacteria bacterium]
MHFKGHGGLKIAADVWGSDNKKLVILLHGGGQTRHAWGETGKKLAEAGYHSVALDLRGHGDSEWHSDADYTIKAYKEDLVSIIKEINKPASLIGASLGGMASLLLAGDEVNSNLCTSLIMVDIGIYPDPAGSDRIVSFMLSGEAGFESLEDVAKSISDYLPHRQKPKDLQGLKKNLRLKEDGKYYWHWDPRFIRRRPGSRDKGYFDLQLKAAQKVVVPTLLMRGALSDVVTMEDVEYFLSVIGHAKFVEIEKAAHMIAGDRNDVFAEEAIKFLRSL